MELLDIVNQEDIIIGQATRSDVYAKQLPHRIVHVLMFDNTGRLALQLRSDSVSFCPNHWSTTVGGHVQTGESYEDAAKREFVEEVGIVEPVMWFSKDYYKTENGTEKFLVTYKAVYTKPLAPASPDVARVDYFSFDEIQHMIDRGEKFHPELLFLLNKYFL